MLAWHEHTVLAVLAADYAGIGVVFLSGQHHFYFATVSLARAHFEYGSVVYLELGR